MMRREKMMQFYFQPVESKKWENLSLHWNLNLFSFVRLERSVLYAERMNKLIFSQNLFDSSEIGPL